MAAVTTGAMSQDEQANHQVDWAIESVAQVPDIQNSTQDLETGDPSAMPFSIQRTWVNNRIAIQASSTARKARRRALFSERSGVQEKLTSKLATAYRKIAKLKKTISVLSRNLASAQAERIIYQGLANGRRKQVQDLMDQISHLQENERRRQERERELCPDCFYEPCPYHMEF